MAVPIYFGGFGKQTAQAAAKNLAAAVAANPGTSQALTRTLAQGAAAGQALASGLTAQQAQMAVQLATQGMPPAQAAAQAVGGVAHASILGKVLPVGLAALGAVGGFFVPFPLLAMPIRAAAGGVLGLLLGAAVAPKEHAAAATMHGESVTFGSEAMDVNFDDTTGDVTGACAGVTAGEIGLPAPATYLKG